MLALLDCPDSGVKMVALRVLPAFFAKMGSTRLARTGLADVFTDVLSPLLLSFPSITPLEEAVQLLPLVYACFVALADSRYPETPRDVLPPEHDQRIRFLEMILRKGILVGWDHCPELPAVVEVLVTWLRELVARLGIYVVRSLTVCLFSIMKDYLLLLILYLKI